MDFPLSVELIFRSRHTVRIGVSEFCGNWMTVTSCLTCLFHQGEPFPQNEANAMDVVIQFAIHKLGFQLSDIIVYAWSIGGFTGTTRPEWCHTLFKKFRVICRMQWADIVQSNVPLPPFFQEQIAPYPSVIKALVVECTAYSRVKPQSFSLTCTPSSPISASWAAMSYPEIQSVVLDASFDDLLPLALKVMPDSWSESSGV